MVRSQRSPELPISRGVPPGTVVLVGAVCVGIGLLAGFYFGKQSIQPAGAVQAQQSSSSFLDEDARLRGILMANPNDLEALIQLGNLCYDNRKFQDAIEWYGRALAIDPQNVNVRTDRGTCYWNLGQADSAIGEFRKSLEVNPSHAQTLYNLGVVFLNGKNDAQEARKAWETLLATNPNYPERAKLQQQLASLMDGSSASTPRSTNPSSPGVEELLQRMKNPR